MLGGELDLLDHGVDGGARVGELGLERGDGLGRLGGEVGHVGRELGVLLGERVVLRGQRLHLRDERGDLVVGGRCLYVLGSLHAYIISSMGQKQAPTCAYSARGCCLR